MTCRICHRKLTETVIDLGDQYLSDFRSDDLKPNKYPLELMRCTQCHFVQLKESAPLGEMYTPNYGFKSGVNDTIRADLADIASQARGYMHKDEGERFFVLDIGSNDGTLLDTFRKTDFTVGIDPITKLCDEARGKGHRIINEFFSAQNVMRVVGDIRFDIITASSMFYDVEDPDALVRDMKALLADDGVLTIQQNYLLATLVNTAYDNICHEHIGYHSLLSMEYLLDKHDLEVVDVSTSLVNGGVLRTVIQHRGVGKPTERVREQRRIERLYGLQYKEVYQEFAERVKESARALKVLISDLNARGKKIYIYGASTRGGTIWQYAGLDVRDLPLAVDRNPEKVGKKIASIGVPIISEEQARLDKPDYMLVSIWFFKNEVLERETKYLKDGHLIFPLPQLEIV